MSEIICYSKCRVCLLEKESKVSMFDNHEDSNYSDLIKEYTGLDVIQSSNLPSEICEECLSELTVVIKFVSKVRTSNETFNDLFNESNNSDKFLFDVKCEEEEKIPLSILSATLKKDKLSLTYNDEDSCDGYDNDNEFNHENELESENIIKEEPSVISLDKLSSYLNDRKNDFVCVTVNNITIKKERIEPKEDKEHEEMRKEESRPKIMSSKRLKKKSKLKKKIILNDLDSKYVVLKAKDHGLTKDMLKCLTCGVLLYNRSSFVVHYRRHTGERPFRCKQCGKSFSVGGALNEHVRHVHLGIKRLKLKNVKPTVADPDENVKYKVLKADEYGLRKDKVQCLTCRLICENKSAFIVHYRKHSGEKPYKCQQCDKCFPRVGTLNDHIKNIHSDSKKNSNDTDTAEEHNGNSLYAIIRAKDHPGLRKDMVQCLTCRLLLNGKFAFRVHYRKHTGERPYKCEHCAKDYQRVGDMNEHMRRVHNKGDGRCRIRKQDRGEESCVCYLCGKKFKHKSSLTIHLRTHTNEKPHECTYCPKKFIRSQELSLHIRIHHTGEKPYSCHLCGKTFAAGTQLKSHLFVHTDEKNFKCKICNTAVKTRDSLAKHMRVMHTTRKNICEICGAAFAFRYGLRDHMKNRHSDRSEMCDICKKPFSDLQKHMITHSDQKPFSCQLCQKGFFRQKSLKAHIIKHHSCVTSSFV